MLFIYLVYLVLYIFRAIVFCTLVFISSYCTKLSFFASACLGHMVWKSSGKYNVMKTQEA